MTHSFIDNDVFLTFLRVVAVAGDLSSISLGNVPQLRQLPLNETRESKSNDHWTVQILIWKRLRMNQSKKSIYWSRIYAWANFNLNIWPTTLKLHDHSWFWWMFWRRPCFFTQHFISRFKFIIGLSKSISSTANANIFQQTQVANLFYVLQYITNNT